MKMDLEFSRILDETAFKAGFDNRKFEASEKELQALCERLGLVNLKSFSVTVNSVEPKLSGEYRVNGLVKAHVTQSCVVSFKPVEDDVEDAFTLRLIPGLTEDMLAKMDEEDEDNDEDIEPLLEEGVDIGEISTQYLSMSLNPYPKAEGADLKEVQVEGVAVLSEEEANKSNNPFKVLENLKDET